MSEVDEEVPTNQARQKRCSVFLRLGAISTPKKKTKRQSIFLRLGENVKSRNPTQRGCVFDRLGRPTSRPIEEQLEEEESSALCLNIEEWDEGILNRATFLAEQARRGPHPWKVKRERFMSTFPCISVRKDKETRLLVHELKDGLSKHEYSLEEQRS
ncbi:hypothetical protein LIER_17570 [Lithospermum erythrorhizon]|uniref:Uncharacterized protein n=1 Tax=Lithospermum erythrorhizon TaxID=34254 RepID=A0AAV3QDD3_LITER